MRKSRSISLNEAVSLLAFGNLDGPDHSFLLDARDAGEWIDPIDVISQSRGDSEAVTSARRQIFAALRDGDLRARGRERDGAMVSELISDIAPHQWREQSVEWEDNATNTPTIRFEDIVFDRRAFEAFIADDEDDSERPKPEGQRRGRKTQYNEREFFAVCVQQAHLDGLDESQAEFITKVAEMLEVLWDGEVPGPTWLKERVSSVYAIQKRYEAARQVILGRE